MDKKQYNNVIDWTLKHEAQAQSEDSLQVTRAICNELGVALPQGDLAQVAEVLATDDYMGWKACAQEEAQEAANNGIPAIGISNDQIVMLAAEDEEQPVANAFAVMTLSNDTKAMGDSVAYYAYGCGTTCVENDSELVIEGIQIASLDNVMCVDERRFLQVLVKPKKPSCLRLVWHSSDSSVIAVTDAGEAWARKVGKAQLSVETADGQHRDTIDVEVVIDTVTILKDGTYNKVVFNKTGKVWRCINCDMIFDKNNMNNTFLIRRSNHNFFTYYNENDPLASNTTPKEYTDEEIKLLYAIDPYGVACYVERYAGELFFVDGLKSVLGYKDRIFRLLFNKEPQYFARTLNGEWYKVDTYEELNDVLSESEVYFGMHPIYDWHTFFEILGVCSSILDIVFMTSFFSINPIGKVISRIVTTGLFVTSGLESVLRNELAGFSAGDWIAVAIENTLPDWAAAYLSLYESLDDLADAMTLNVNCNKEIIDYCACHTGYNVLFEMKNGTVHNLKEVCDMIS